jgi:hypothetical protein
MTFFSDSFLTTVTDIGDTASLLAVVAAGSLYLIVRKSGRAAAFLATSLVTSAMLIALLKIFFLGCHKNLGHSNILSPSGHAADSAAVYWAFALLMRSQLEASRRFLPLLILTLLIAAIAYSRVRLGFHTPAEVAVGMLTGFIAVVIAYFFVLRGRTPGSFDAYALALWIVVAAFLLHGQRLPMETWIRSLAQHVKNHVPFCGVID